VKKKLGAAALAFAVCSATIGTIAGAIAQPRTELAVFVTMTSDEPIPARVEQRMIAAMIRPLHARLEEVHHSQRFTDGRVACSVFPAMTAIVSVETIAKLQPGSHPWPPLAEVPAMRWTPRDVNVRMHYTITLCQQRGLVVATDSTERQYDRMSMHEGDALREGDAIVRTGRILATSVAESWARTVGR
jgi:hypothetical protein